MSGKVLAGIGIAVLVLVVVAVVIALQPVPDFDRGTPEGTTQGYFDALNEGDRDTAATYLTEDLRVACADAWWFYEDGAISRVVITDVSTIGTETEVDVSITESYGDGVFDAGSYEHDEVLVMTLVGDTWLISEPVWPMDIFACREGSPDG